LREPRAGDYLIYLYKHIYWVKGGEPIYSSKMRLILLIPLFGFIYCRTVLSRK